MRNPEEKYGDKIKYDPLWKGPMKITRFITDKIWLIIFVLFLFLYVFTAIYGFTAGNILAIHAPIDSAGRTCGYHPGVENKSYLMHLNLSSCVNELKICTGKTACVEECPTENFLLDDEKDMNIIKQKLICTTDINMTTITNREQIDILVKHGRCARYYLASESIRQECVPKSVWPGHEGNTITDKDLKIARLAIIGEYDFLKRIAMDVNKVSTSVLITIMCGGILSLASLLLLRWFAVPFFYSSFCMFFGVCAYLIYKMIVSYLAETGHHIYLFGTVVFSIILIAVVVAVIIFRKKIHLACKLIKESSKAVHHFPLTLLFPVIPWFFYIMVLILGIAVFYALRTITVPAYEIERVGFGSYEICQCQDYPESSLNNSVPCDPDVFNSKCKTPTGDACLFLQCRLKGMINTPYVGLFHAVNFIGLYWFLFFVHGFELMVLGGTFASWYWTFNKKNIDDLALLKSISRTSRYHLGTIAIGSLILPIARILKIFVHGLTCKIGTERNCLKTCCRSVNDFVYSYLIFLSNGAYIMCAIHGQSFLKSAKSSFQLVMRNALTVVVDNTVADMLFMMVKLLITSIVVVGLGAYYASTRGEQSDEAGSVTAALALSSIGTYLIISVIFSVQSVAVNTIFLCFIEDSERNDGSVDRPYYMSEKLEKFLNK